MSLCNTICHSLTSRQVIHTNQKRLTNLSLYLSHRKSHGTTTKPIFSLFTHSNSEKAVKRFSNVMTKVKADDNSGTDVDAIVKDLTEKWDKLENKSTIAVYGIGVIILLYFTSSIVTAVNSIPLLPKILELVGFAYTAWFVYRYILFKDNREELVEDITQLKSRITGSEKEGGVMVEEENEEKSLPGLDPEEKRRRVQMLSSRLREEANE